MRGQPDAATTGAGPSTSGAAMADRHRRFLEEVTLLISDPERETFLALTQPHQRDRFMQRFWQVRDPPADRATSSRARWEANAEVARARFVDLRSARAGGPVLRRGGAHAAHHL